jgi:hypothetical protein
MATKAKKPAGDKKPGPVAKKPAQPGKLSPVQLADWLEKDALLTVTEWSAEDEDRAKQIVAFLRSNKIRSQKERHCCSSRRGKDVPHKPECVPYLPDGTPRPVAVTSVAKG